MRAQRRQSQVRTAAGWACYPTIDDDTQGLIDDRRWTPGKPLHWTDDNGDLLLSDAPIRGLAAVPPALLPIRAEIGLGRRGETAAVAV